MQKLCPCGMDHVSNLWKRDPNRPVEWYFQTIPSWFCNSAENNKRSLSRSGDTKCDCFSILLVKTYPYQFDRITTLRRKLGASSYYCGTCFEAKNLKILLRKWMNILLWSSLTIVNSNHLGSCCIYNIKIGIENGSRNSLLFGRVPEFSAYCTLLKTVVG